MANRAEGVADVYINDQQAQNSLKTLEVQAGKLNGRLNEMRKANDKLGYDKTQKELAGVQKEMKGMSRETKEEQAAYKAKAKQLPTVDGELTKVQKELENLANFEQATIDKIATDLQAEIDAMDLTLEPDIVFDEEKVDENLKGFVDAYQAAALALTSAPPPWFFIQMGAVIAAGLANVMKINSVQFATGKYDVIGASDGRTYRAGYASRASTGIYRSPTLIGGLGLVADAEIKAIINSVSK